jgi:hypothetical protein
MLDDFESGALEPSLKVLEDHPQPNVDRTLGGTLSTDGTQLLIVQTPLITIPSVI